MTSRGWWNNAPASRLERRRLQRVQLAGTASINCLGETTRARGVVQNVSAEGVFLWTEVAVALGSSVEVTVLLPPKNSFVNQVMLWCVGKVVRTEGTAKDGNFGVAIHLDDIEITAVPASA